MRPTLQDIAEKAGVSTATVSRTLNDRPGVHPDTRSEILRIAQELGYIASAESSDGTATLGLITYKWTPEPVTILDDQLLQGSDHEAHQNGYHIITTYVNETMMATPLDLPVVRDKRVDGLILVGPALTQSFIMELHDSGLPIILVDNSIPHSNIDTVNADNIGGVYRVTRHLLEQHERRRLVFLSGPDHWFSSQERRQGYERALHEFDCLPHVIYMPETTLNSGYEATLSALEQHSDLDGIVAVNDATALGAIRAMKEHGHSVPEDIAVVGFDNVRWSTLNEPKLTTVHMFMYEMGIQATHRLIDVIERGAQTSFQLRLGTKVIVRESCGGKR